MVPHLKKEKNFGTQTLDAIEGLLAILYLQMYSVGAHRVGKTNSRRRVNTTIYVHMDDVEREGSKRMTGEGAFRTCRPNRRRGSSLERSALASQTSE